MNARQMVDALRGWWLSLVVVAGLLIGGLALVASQQSSAPARAMAASDAAWKRKLAVAETLDAKAAARAQAADDAFQRAAAKDEARQERQDQLAAQQAGEGNPPTASYKSSAPGDPGPQTAPPAQGKPRSRPQTAPLARSGGPGSLTLSQLRAAEDGATAIAQECLDETENMSPNSPKLNADISAAAKGVNDLKDALRQDPDTQYKPLDAPKAPPETMRQLATEDAYGACAGGVFAQDLAVALLGLPH